MDKSQSHKIGFKLFGNLLLSSDENKFERDENQTYEILFSPGEAPLGTITHLLRQDEKKVAVELPEEMRQNNFENVCSFLLEKGSQLILNEYGHEKLGNRKLILASSYVATEVNVNIRISIQGKWQSARYNIEINPFDITSSSGEVQKLNAKGYSKATITLEELVNVKKNEALKVLPKLKPNNFNVTIDQDQIIIDLGSSLKHFIDSLGKPSKYQKAKIEKSSSPVVANEIPLHSDEEMMSSLIKEMSSTIEEEIEEEKPSKGGMWPMFKKMMGRK